eukprot:m.228369 g.228369  ORF g.228369 m.228369 type:complete len:391 (-) comp37823_c0_seq1:53-1225(-)
MAMWACTMCTFENKPLHLTCAMCLTPRAPNTPPQQSHPTHAGPARSEPPERPSLTTDAVWARDAVAQETHRQASQARAAAHGGAKGGRKRTASIASFLTRKEELSKVVRKAGEATPLHSAAATGTGHQAASGSGHATVMPSGDTAEGVGASTCVTHAAVSKGKGKERRVSSDTSIANGVPLPHRVDVTSAAHASRTDHTAQSAQRLPSGGPADAAPSMSEMAQFLGALRCPASKCGTLLGQSGYLCQHDRCGVTVCEQCAKAPTCPVCKRPSLYSRNLSLEKWAAAVGEVFPPTPSPQGESQAQSANEPPPTEEQDDDTSTLETATIELTPAGEVSGGTAIATPHPSHGQSQTAQSHDKSSDESGSDFFEDSDPESQTFQARVRGATLPS